MDFQRIVVWVVFCFSLVLLWDRWEVAHGHKPMFFPAPAPAVAASASKTSPPAAIASLPSVPAGSVPGRVPGAESSADSSSAVPVKPVEIVTDVLRIDIDPQGGSIVRAVLRKENRATNWKAEGLAGFISGQKPGPKSHELLFDHSTEREYEGQTGLIGGDAFPNHRNTRFTVLPGPTALASGEKTLQVVLEGRSGGVMLRKTFVFQRAHYDVQVQQEVKNLGPKPISPSLYLQLVRDNGTTGEEGSFYKTYTGPATYTDQDHYRKIPFKKIAENDATVPPPATNGWVAMVQHYFLTAWIPQGTMRREFYVRALSDRLFAVGTLFPLGTIAPGASVTRDAILYVGPQDHRELATLAPGLERVEDYGWLDPIAKPLFWLLTSLHRLVGNWGWAIVALTLLIKLAFYPLSAAGYKSMAKMKELAPRMQRLKEQFGEDKQKLQLAMMELYKKEKVNPLGGCLPIMVQIPVFIALYWVLLGSVEMRNAPWILWIHDLATPDPWFVLPVVMMCTSWIQFRLQPTPPDPVQARMMMIMPFAFGIMFFFFPAGLVLYYVLNNGLSILQQWRINQVIARAKRVAA